jgi:hypothetical protein
MKTLSKKVLVCGAMVCVLWSAGSVVAQGGARTATVEISNTGGVGESECIVSGKRSEAPNKGGLKFLAKHKHKGDTPKSFDTQIPAEFVGVRTQCKPLTNKAGKVIEVLPTAQQSRPFVEQIISRVPLQSQYAKASCAGAQCVHSLILR